MPAAKATAKAAKAFGLWAWSALQSPSSLLRWCDAFFFFLLSVSFHTGSIWCVCVRRASLARAMYILRRKTYLCCLFCRQVDSRLGSELSVYVRCTAREGAPGVFVVQQAPFAGGFCLLFRFVEGCSAPACGRGSQRWRLEFVPQISHGFEYL